MSLPAVLSKLNFGARISVATWIRCICCSSRSPMADASAGSSHDDTGIGFATPADARRVAYGGLAFQPYSICRASHHADRHRRDLRRPLQRSPGDSIIPPSKIWGSSGPPRTAIAPGKASRQYLEQKKQLSLETPAPDPRPLLLISRSAGEYGVLCACQIDTDVMFPAYVIRRHTTPPSRKAWRAPTPTKFPACAALTPIVNRFQKAHRR